MKDLGTEAQNMGVVFGRIKERYREDKTRNRFNKIVPNMYKHTPFPMLRGKAAEIKDLVAVMGYVADEFLNADLDYDALVLRALRTSAHADEILAEQKDNFFLEGQALARFKRSIAQYNAILVELGLRSHPHGAGQ